MGELSERIQLTLEHRELLLKYAHPSTRLLGSLGRWRKNQAIRRIWMSHYEVECLLGELSRLFNHEETGSDSGAVLERCDHLEYAEQTGDGDLDMMW